MEISIMNNKELGLHLQMKTNLMCAIARAVKERESTQANIAELLEISQPRLSDLMKHKIDKFSLDALVKLGCKMGLRISLTIEA